MRKQFVTLGKEKMVQMDEKVYAYWLHNIKGIGDKTAIKLWKVFGDARAVYSASEKKLEGYLSQEQTEALLQSRGEWRLEDAYYQMQQKKIQMVHFFEETYPKRLQKIATPPFALYYLGKLPQEEQVSLAIIGARECSEYGRYVAQAFAKRATLAGVNIISGMARGIDGIGQQAAVDMDGATFAVLGCGVDICYPKEHHILYEQIQEKGGIISPYPPGTKPARNLFPYRNQIVAGLSDGVLVVEARQKSGTLITVDMALEQGKDVYAVPGRLTDRLSDGCNYLIRQGAGIALSPEDVMAELVLLKNRQGGGKEQAVKGKSGNINRHVMAGVSGKTKRHKAESVTEKAQENEREEGILCFLDLKPLTSDEILEKMLDAGEDISLQRLLFELIRLCMEGKAKQIEGNYFVKVMK